MKNAILQKKATDKVLIVEDEGEMCLLLNILLDREQVELNYAKDIVSAGEYLQKELPSFVILDNKLPDGFGVDFISYLKRKYPSIKILMISGFGSARDVAMENGADAFLEKPFSRNQFYKSINRFLH
jgi:two-component system, OmpR family, response regulator